MAQFPLNHQSVTLLGGCCCTNSVAHITIVVEHLSQLMEATTTTIHINNPNCTGQLHRTFRTTSELCKPCSIPKCLNIQLVVVDGQISHMRKSQILSSQKMGATQQNETSSDLSQPSILGSQMFPEVVCKHTSWLKQLCETVRLNLQWMDN